MSHPTQIRFTTFGYHEEPDSVEVVKSILRKVYGAGANYTAFERARRDLKTLSRRVASVRSLSPAFHNVEMSPFVEAAVTMLHRGERRERAAHKVQAAG